MPDAGEEQGEPGLKPPGPGSQESYSIARRDRTGAQVQDDLMAWWYSRAHRYCYTGSRGERFFEEHESMCRLLGIPPPACAPLPEDRNRLVLPPEGYRDTSRPSAPGTSRCAEIFDEPFRRFLRSRAPGTTFVRPIREPYIAVHVRRGDVRPDDAIRHLPNEHYRVLVDRARREHGVQTCVVVSEANARESLRRDFPDCEHHVGESLDSSWRILINADVLILSKSSFSYVPAIYCTGSVVYTPFWHAPLAGWVTAEV